MPVRAATTEGLQQGGNLGAAGAARDCGDHGVHERGLRASGKFHRARRRGVMTTDITIDLLTRASELDAADPLAGWRDQFHIPDADLAYLDGNSLGMPPRRTLERVSALIAD